MNPTTTRYAEGDLVTVISDHPTYRIGRTHLPSKATKGDLFRVADVWDDGDLTLHTPEGERTGYVVSPQHVEPYVAPAIFIASTARQAGKRTWLDSLWSDLGYTEYAAPSLGWATVQEGLDRAQAIIDEGLAEPDEMDRRADALEEAIDLLGDERTVEEYVAAARFLLGLTDEEA
jgi:hypothetical protein